MDRGKAMMNWRWTYTRRLRLTSCDKPAYSYGSSGWRRIVFRADVVVKGQELNIHGRRVLA